MIEYGEFTFANGCNSCILFFQFHYILGMNETNVTVTSRMLKEVIGFMLCREKGQLDATQWFY